MADTHEGEYDDDTVAMLELIWGEGFLVPGGSENVHRTIAGLDLTDKVVLDIGSGVGGVDLILAGEHGARVIGLEIEQALVARARDYAARSGLSERVEFRHVDPGPLQLDDDCVDVVFSSGTIIHIEDKAALFKEIFRVLRPGGVLAVYDWLKGPDPYSDDMRYWFEMEGLTYAMETPRGQEAILREAGFDEISVMDGSAWYRTQVRAEYERLRTSDFPRLVELIGKAAADHTVENWRAAVVVCEKGEMRQVYTRSRKP